MPDALAILARAMGKNNKASRKEKREERKREEAARQAALEAASARRRTLLIAIGVATAAVGGGIYFTEAPRALLGLTILVGIGAFLAVALGGQLKSGRDLGNALHHGCR